MQHPTTRGTCTNCGGKGYLIRARQIGRGQFVREDEACPVCNGDGNAPQPTPPAPASALLVTDSFEIAGHRVTAPGFSPESFDRAIYRAHNDGLQVAPTDRSDCVLVSNPTNGASYTVSRRSCTCKAGQRGTGCKHRALAIFLADIVHSLPVASPTAVAA